MGRPFSAYVTRCETHNKRLFSSRDRARAAIREMGGKGMRPYRCDAIDGGWHFGHLPPAVLEGRLTADEIYRPTTREDTNREPA